MLTSVNSADVTHRLKAHRDHMLHHWSGKPQTASVSLPSLPQASDHILDELDLAFLDLTGPERQDLQESHCFLGLFVAFDVLYDHLGFAVLGDDQRFPAFVQFPYDFSGMSLQVTDGVYATASKN